MRAMTLDPAARRSARRVKAAADKSKAHLDAKLVIVARKVGQHGLRNFMETVRQRCNTSITETYARDLLSRGGYPQSMQDRKG